MLKPLLNRKKKIAVSLILSAALVTFIGCQKKEGPAERAGKSLDNATEKVGQKIERAGENIRDAARDRK